MKKDIGHLVGVASQPWKPANTLTDPPINYKIKEAYDEFPRWGEDL